MTSVKVAVRVRPLSKREIEANSSIAVHLTDKIVLTNTKIPEVGCEGDIAREATRMKEFSFNYIFWSVDKDLSNFCSQEKLFHQFGTDIVSSAYDGYNACAFAYGQPGSGKTYTMIGTQENRGLIPRICEDLFQKMNRDDESATYRVEISFMEIYNEKVRDLLETSDNRPGAGLRVREHPKHGPFVEGLSHHIAVDDEDALDIVRRGEVNRCTAPTNMNDVSSRSHAIFTLIFTQARIYNGMPYETQSRIHLVDLAGSESADATGATGKRLKEGGNINRSLVTLGTVITLLAKSSEPDAEKKVFIPYRDSKLTWLLKDSLGGNAKTFMIATISPADINYNETLRTLRYAVGAKNIVNKPTKNEDSSVRLIRQLKEEIKRLKAMLGGDLDKATEPRVKEMLQESEVRVKVLTEEWNEKWHETKITEDTMAIRKEGMGIMLDSVRPHLIGIDDDIFSTGITLYNLKEGQTTIGRVDASKEQDIKITGVDIQKEHCYIWNENGEVQLIPNRNSPCSVNGTIVHGPTKLLQGSVILLGKTNMFRYNNPTEAIRMKEELQDHGISLSRDSSVGYGRSLSDMYRSTDSLSSSTWETTDDFGDNEDSLEEQRKYINLMEKRYDQAQVERDSEISEIEREVQDITTKLGELQAKVSKCSSQMSLYDKSMKKITEDHMQEKETISAELVKLQKELERTMRTADNDMLVLEEKVDDLVVSQVTLQKNVHQQIQTLLQKKAETMKDIKECEASLTTLESSLQNEKLCVLSGSDEYRKKLSTLDQYEQNVMANLQLESNRLQSRQDQAELHLKSEMAKIEEAWKDIFDNENAIKEKEKKKLNTSEKLKLRQRKMHIKEAKELLIGEHESILDAFKNSENKIKNDTDDYNALKRKSISNIHQKRNELFTLVSPKLLDLENKLFIKRQEFLDKEVLFGKCEKEIENFEEMLKLSTESCNKQQQVMDLEKNLKIDDHNVKEQQIKTTIHDLESRLNILDKQFEETKGKLKESVRHLLQIEDKEDDVIQATKKDIERLQELYNKKHSELLSMKQQSEERQDQEFESLELEIMKLEEMQNKARIEQEIQRRLKNVRQNKLNRRSNYESFASLEAVDDDDDVSVTSYSLFNASRIGVNVTAFSLKNSGSDSFYEFEIQMLIGKDNWKIYRRYRRFREMHKELRRKIPEMRKLNFPPKKIFTKSEKVLEQRRKQLEVYLQNVLEIFIKTPWCPLHPCQNKDLNMKLLCDFEPFFKRGLFEGSTNIK